MTHDRIGRSLFRLSLVVSSSSSSFPNLIRAEGADRTTCVFGLCLALSPGVSIPQYRPSHLLGKNPWGQRGACPQYPFFFSHGPLAYHSTPCPRPLRRNEHTAPPLPSQAHLFYPAPPLLPTTPHSLPPHRNFAYSTKLIISNIWFCFFRAGIVLLILRCRSANMQESFFPETKGNLGALLVRYAPPLR